MSETETDTHELFEHEQETLFEAARQASIAKRWGDDEDSQVPVPENPFALTEEDNIPVKTQETDTVSDPVDDADSDETADTAPETETTEEEAPAADDPAPARNAYLLARAAQHGLNPAAYSDAQLGDMLAVLDARAVSPPGQAPPAPAQAQPSLELPKFEIPAELREQMDEPSLKAIEVLNNHYASQQTNLLGELTELKTQQQQIREAENLRELDSFNQYCEKSQMSDVLGKGPVQTLVEGTPEYANRMQLWNQINTLRYGRAFVGQPELPLTELANQAARILFPDHFERQVRDSLKKNVKKRSNALSVPPTKRNVDEPQMSPRDAAMARMTEILKRKGRTED